MSDFHNVWRTCYRETKQSVDAIGLHFISLVINGQNVTLYYVTLETIYSGLSTSNFKDHQTEHTHNTSIERRKGVERNINTFNSGADMLGHSYNSNPRKPVYWPYRISICMDPR